MWTINLPVSVPVSKRKRFPLNINHYRNAHHQVLAKAKRAFSEEVYPKLKHLPQLDAVKLTYTLFVGTGHRTDVSNVCAIVDKFFSDVLVTSGRIEDDNYNVVVSVDYRYGGIDKVDPRVEVTVEPVGTIHELTTSKEEEMQITIIQSEIETAIRNYIMSQITVREGQRIDIDLKATRGPEGYQAVIDIVPENTPAPVRKNTEEDQPAAKDQKEVKETPKPIAKAKPFAAKEDKSEVVTQEVGETPAAEPETAPEPETEAGTKANETAKDEAPETPPASNTRSIFANMKKPVNA